MKKPIEPVYRQFGCRVEAIRTVMGMSQLDLAKKVRLTRTSITNIESGHQRILLSDVTRFSQAFGISEKNLLRGIWT